MSSLTVASSELYRVAGIGLGSRLKPSEVEVDGEG